MPIVSTGQITIVDNNDARPITAFIAASSAVQQVYSKDESAITFLPDWSASPVTLTAKVYVGATNAALEVSAQLTSRKWSTSFDGASLGSGVTYVRNTNLTPESPNEVLFFQGDYEDPATGLVSRVNAQITISLVKTGTNAVFLVVEGQNVIEQATGQTKNVARLSANLYRASGIDNSGVTYRWFETPFAAANQLDGNFPSITSKYGFLTGAQVLASAAGAVGQINGAAITTSNMPNDGWTDSKGILIHESAVNDIGLYKCEAKDSDGTIYQAFFTIYDVSDPYEVVIQSTAGDKLQNGVGSTTLTPKVYYGADEVTVLTGWVFTWNFYDRSGNRAAFVNPTKTAGARTISAHTTGATATVTYSGSAFTSVVAGEIVKLVDVAGSASFYEAASNSGSVLTLRAATTNTWLNYPAITASQFIGGKLFRCDGSLTGASVVITGDDIDVKGRITCEANRP